MFCSNLSKVSNSLSLVIVANTVKPLVSVVVSVFTPFLATGVAKPLFSGATALRAARLRSPWARFKASRRDAMELRMEVVRMLEIERWNAGIDRCRFLHNFVEALLAQPITIGPINLCKHDS